MQISVAAEAVRPRWLKKRLDLSPEAGRTRGVLSSCGVRTVCESSRCPNTTECFARGKATFLILGGRCTRSCAFCSAGRGARKAPDSLEPDRVARAVAMLGLKYAVVTSVTRDDLPDGGSSAFAEVIRSVRRFSPETVVEVLVPDFRGMGSSVAEVTSASPGVFGHNIETVRRLYPAVRMGAGYDRSLGLLKSAKSCAPHIPVKSGLMLGMGETDEEVIGTIHDIRRAGCDMLTIGQYMRPSKENLPVRRFYGMLEFDRYRAIALEAGFAAVKSGPFVRSSYFAEESYNNIKGGLS